MMYEVTSVVSFPAHVHTSPLLLWVWCARFLICACHVGKKKVCVGKGHKDNSESTLIVVATL